MSIPDFSPAAYGRILERVHRPAVGYLETLPERAAFRRPPDEVVRRFEGAPLPRNGTAAETILADVERDILPYSLGIGPRGRPWVGVGNPVDGETARRRRVAGARRGAKRSYGS